MKYKVGDILYYRNSIKKNFLRNEPRQYRIINVGKTRYECLIVDEYVNKYNKQYFEHIHKISEEYYISRDELKEENPEYFL